MRTFALALGTTFVVFAGSAWAADTIGLVKTVGGAAFIATGSTRVAATVGAPVHQDDVIETGAGGAVGITFKDNTTMSIGPDTKLVVDEFVFAPEREQYGFRTRMVQGTLYYVSGTMAKLAPDSVSVATPVGTIGIRGTRFLVKVDGASR